MGQHGLCQRDDGAPCCIDPRPQWAMRVMVQAVAQEVLEVGTGDSAETGPVLGGQCELRAGVVPMSKHPYGCRVIQRILEHCTLPDVKAAVKTQVALPPSPETIWPYPNGSVEPGVCVCLSGASSMQSPGADTHGCWCTLHLRGGATGKKGALRVHSGCITGAGDGQLAGPGARRVRQLHRAAPGRARHRGGQARKPCGALSGPVRGLARRCCKCAGAAWSTEGCFKSA